MSLPNTEDLRRIQKYIDEMYPYCYVGTLCQHRAHHHCMLLERTKPGECLFFKGVSDEHSSTYREID